MIRRLLDVNVYRGESGGMSDHYLVECKLRIQFIQNRRTTRFVRECVKVSELSKNEKKEEFQERVQFKFSELDVIEGDVEEEWDKFKAGVIESANIVCGVRKVGEKRRRGSEWWNDECRKVVEEKRSYEKW